MDPKPRPVCRVKDCEKLCDVKHKRHKRYYYSQCRPHRLQHKGMFNPDGSLKYPQHAALFKDGSMGQSS